MAINEEIVTGRKFRKLVDAATKKWQRISFWHRASDCEFDDGKTAETKVGAIDGITDSLVSTSSRIAASAKALNQVNNNLTAMPQWMTDPATGRITGYKTPGGADTVFPFSQSAFGILPKGTSDKTVKLDFTPTIVLVSAYGSYVHSVGGYLNNKNGTHKSYYNTWASVDKSPCKIIDNGFILYPYSKDSTLGFNVAIDTEWIYAALR